MEVRTKIILFSCLSVLAAFIVLWDRSKAVGTTEAGTPVDLVDLSGNPDKGAGSAGALVNGTGKTGPADGAVASNPTGTTGATGTADPGSGAGKTDTGATEPGPDTLVVSTPETGPTDGATGKTGDGNTHTALPGEGLTGGHTEETGGAGAHETPEGAGKTVAAEEHPEPQIYKVKAGDYPFKIAEEVYGDGNKYKLILEANKGKVNAQGTNLKVGMELSIPALPGKTPAAHEETPVTVVHENPETHGAGTPAAGKSGEYVIQPGDSLSKISQKIFGTPSRWNEIYEANTDRLSSPDDLTVGETITIPAGR